MCRNVALWCALCFAPVCSAGLFDNKEQQAEKLFRQNEFETAAEAFSDSYRRGVAQYRAGQYGQAAESFNRVQRESVKTDALYNLGNSRFQEGKLEALQTRTHPQKRKQLELALDKAMAGLKSTEQEGEIARQGKAIALLEAENAIAQLEHELVELKEKAKP